MGGERPVGGAAWHAKNPELAVARYAVARRGYVKEVKLIKTRRNSLFPSQSHNQGYCCEARMQAEVLH